MGQETNKWYSHGLTPQEVGKLFKYYARIAKPEPDGVELRFLLGEPIKLALTSQDITELLNRTGVRYIRDLDGKFVEVHKDKDDLVRCISDAPYLQ